MQKAGNAFGIGENRHRTVLPPLIMPIINPLPAFSFVPLSADSASFELLRLERGMSKAPSHHHPLEVLALAKRFPTFTSSKTVGSLTSGQPF